MHLLIYYNMGSKSAIGIGNGICFKQVRDKGGGSYIDPLVRDSIVGLWKSDQNTNESPTRNIIKNTIKGKGGDLELLNFGYKLNSGYGKYEEDFTDWIIYPNIKVTDSVITTDGNFKSSWFIYKHSSKSKINEMNIKVSGIPKGGKILYFYISDETANSPIAYTIPKDGIYHLPESKINNNRASVGFTVESRYDWNNIRIEQIPSFEGALVTDGVDDLITSTKTVQEMLGGSNEVTVVSMIHLVQTPAASFEKAYTNQIRTGQNYLRNYVTDNGKTGIYGYTCKGNNVSVINNILGDKNDYTVENKSWNNLAKFSVIGYEDNGTINELDQVAWYWTIIANKVLTTDQINQVISYFNLDKHVKPDIIYDTIRQGITNENHASFNDELVDFSGNGHNMKIYNSAWNKESGINDEGAWQADGVSDYGNVENLPILKDYTVAIERRWITSPVDKNQCLAFKGHTNDWGAFACEFSNAGQLRSYTFSPTYNILQSYNEKSLVYQSKYSYSGTPIDAKATIDGSTLRLCLPRGGFPFYANVAIKMFLLFPYSLSEFLLERQLKKYKLGTLYPDMVEFRPIIKNNNQYKRIDFYTQSWDKKIYPGDYVPINSILRANIYLNNELNELQSFRINGVNVTFVKSSIDKTAYNIGNIPIAKSPQKIDITIDEYIRFEDIIQPYPAIINLSQDGKSITWGDKLKVGSEVTFVNHTNLLPDLYTVSDGVQYNGTSISWNTSIRVEKSMVFVNPHSYKKANEPNCILAPQTLRIPNSSYKILGYIPDLTGKGNHGKLNNFAYTEDSGVASDGSIKIDGTDDHITISNIIGGKCIMAKVTLNRNSGIIYDQRRANVPNKSWMQLNPSSVIFEQNAVSTYIDGILNHNVTGSDLVSKTVNLTCELEIGDTSGTYQPTIGSSYAVGYTTDINLYEFMLFPDVPDEEEIKELNDIIGIEGGYVESPNYYWDSFGKKNTDTDRNLIADQVSKDVANALEVKNVAYNSESGYTDDNGLLLDGVEDHAINTVISAVTDFTVIAKRTDLRIIDDLTSSFIQKGLSAVWNVGGAFSEGRTEADKQYCSTFGNSNDISNVYNKEFFYETKNSYNGKAITIRTDKTDSNGLSIGAIMNNGSALGGYWKGIFYKLMFYTKTIDQLSINMLKNLFERDELIDITNPIFKKKEL